MNLTKRGISLDLPSSPYVATYFIDGKQYDFCFSSKLHLNNFNEKRDEEFLMLYNYLYKRFKFRFNCRALSDCKLYHKIETRGFYIKIDNKGISCPSKVILNGESRMNKNLGGWRETLTIS